MQNAIVGLGTIAVIVIAFLCLKGTVGGSYMRVVLVLTLIHFVVLPLGLWFYSLSTKGKIGFLVGCVAYVFILIFGPGFISGIGESSPSLEIDRTAKERDAKIERIKFLDRDIKANQDGIDGMET